MRLKNSRHLLADVNTKQFGYTPEEKYFAPLKILYLFIKSFVNSLLDISLTFMLYYLFFFATSLCLVSFEVTLLLFFF